jgi:hypothetical protein
MRMGRVGWLGGKLKVDTQKCRSGKRQEAEATVGEEMAIPRRGLSALEDGMNE